MVRLGTRLFTCHGGLGLKVINRTLYKVGVCNMGTVLRGMVRGRVGHGGGDGLEEQRVL
jgi:hypothetical protein